MSSHRTLRVAEAIREVVSSTILFDTADPRVKGITVLRAEVTGDLRNAAVYVTVMGTDAERKKAMQGLQSASGFLQARVAARLQTRFTPVLTFKLDDSVKKSVEMSRLIDEALASDRLAVAERSQSDPSQEFDEPETHSDTDTDTDTDDPIDSDPN